MSQVFLNTTADKVLRTLQLVQLDCVEEIDRICRKYGIEYSLGGGTCLGRYRHGGFIPWDDDIDIDMTWDNYDKFMEVAPAEIDSERFKLVCKATVPGHYRTMSRLEAVGTRISLPRWDKNDVKVGVFVDILRIVYLPDDEALRTQVRDKLFFLRSAENYLMTGDYPRALSATDRKRVAEFVKKESPESIMEQEEEIIRKYCIQPTNWKYADCLIANNYNGYTAEGSEENIDVPFDRLTLRDRKNAVPFLTDLYGENFAEWLPPVKRVSHHKWTKLDLGRYAEMFDLPSNYDEYFTVKYNEDKLRQMQDVSLHLAEQLDKLCFEHGLKYYVAGYDAWLEADGLADREVTPLWKESMTVVMPREDYDVLMANGEDWLPHTLMLQTRDSSPNYYYQHARLRLNYTELTDRRLPLSVRDSINNGFYIRILPMDNAVSQEDNRRIDLLNKMLFIKWTKPAKNVLDSFGRLERLKLRSEARLTTDELWDKINVLMRKADTEKSATKYRLSIDDECRSVTIDASVWGEGRRVNYGGVELTFPADPQSFLKTAIAEHYKGADLSEVAKRYPRCSLTFYGNPDYQFSVLRYDEKQDRMLTNEELFAE